MRDFFSNLEKYGEEEVLLPILDKISENLVKVATIIGIPFVLLLLLQFSFLLF
ncbi:hypothetical protein [Sutcliffiella deserti]|uniref:hypothetical protein n=1 Tax=Sutcliffiella deserti TaxID=2875501 RepID=UPI001CBD4268|nr:hypothetical protein [Sutcliffiella deserti]